MTANKVKKKETKHSERCRVGQRRGEAVGEEHRWMKSLTGDAVVSAGLRSSQRTDDGEPRH